MTRTLRFQCDGDVDLGATVRVVQDGLTVSADVSVEPPRRYRVEIRHHDGPVRVAFSDAGGRAHLGGIQRGLVSIYLMPHGGADGIGRTAWVSL